MITTTGYLVDSPYPQDAARPRGNVAATEDQIRAQLAQLEDALNVLVKGLDPILRAPEPMPASADKGANDAEYPNRSEMAVSLDDIRLRVRRLTRVTEELIERVDL